MNIQNEHVSEQTLITQLFDTQPDSVVWFIPKFNENDKAVPADFEVGYCNTAASLILGTSKQQIIGSLLGSSDLMDGTCKQKTWDQCLQIWKTGENMEFSYYDPVMNKNFNVQRSKVLNGVLSITRDHTKFIKGQEEKEQQSRLLNQIIETSSSGISLYEAVRNKNGKLLDFKLKIANQKAAEITAFKLDDLYKYTVKELMLVRGQSNFFEMVSKVTETGEPVYTEYFSQTRNQWIAFAIQKFNDGYLLNYIDVTFTKNLEKKAQDQAHTLNGILNASITGLVTLQAIYNFLGKVDDFKFILLNDAAEKLLGIKKGDKNKTYLTLFPDAKTNGFFDLYANVLTKGEPISKEIFYKGGGYNGWYYISVSKMNADTIVQSFADITHTRENKSLDFHKENSELKSENEALKKQLKGVEKNHLKD